MTRILKSLLLITLSPVTQAYAQQDPPTAACISVVSTSTATSTTMVYTNNCKVCAELVPVLRGADGSTRTGATWAALSRRTLVVVRLEPGESDIAGWDWKVGNWTGLATQVKACR